MLFGTGPPNRNPAIDTMTIIGDFCRKQSKAKVLNSCPLVTSIYKTPDNPVFEIFFLEEAVATIADFSGNPPKTYTL